MGNRGLNCSFASLMPVSDTQGCGCLVCRSTNSVMFMNHGSGCLNMYYEAVLSVLVERGSTL